MSRLIRPAARGRYQISRNTLLVEQVIPQVVARTGSLPVRLTAVAAERGRSESWIQNILESIPLPLLNADCFLDAATNIWRYEFGRLISLDGQKLL